MILSYKQLRKREVVNIADGRSFGKITDLKIEFPCAVLKGIVVCEKSRTGLLWFLHRNEIFIDESHIVRIGGDVILVNITRTDAVTPTVVEMNASGGKKEPVKIAQSPAKRPPHPENCRPPISGADCCPPPFPPCPPSPCPPSPCPPCPPADKAGYFAEETGVDYDGF